MKVHVLSDLHTDVEDFSIPDSNADVLVLAGDIGMGVDAVEWSAKATDKPVVFVPGNHEYYRQKGMNFSDKLRSAADPYPHVHLLMNSVAVIGGVRFIGTTLWTDMLLHGEPRLAINIAEWRLTDYKLIRTTPGYRKLRASDTRGWHDEAVSWLREQLLQPFDGPTVVVTHHAPSARSLPERFRHDLLSAAYASHLDDLVEASGAELWIHGHIHTRADYLIGNTRVVCNPRGYDGIEPGEGFKPDLLVDI